MKKKIIFAVIILLITVGGITMYQKIGWENSPSVKTSLSAENFEHMDEGIYQAHLQLAEIPNEISLKANTDDVNAALLSKANQIDLEVERARINNLIAVEASTDNAETADIRVGIDGKTYDSAGGAVRGQINNISEVIFTRNVFNSDVLLGVPDCTKSGDVYTCTASALSSYGVLYNNFEEEEFYTLSLKAKTDANVSSSGNGLAIRFLYSDGKNNTIFAPNSTTDWTEFILKSDGRNIIGFVINVNNGGANIWHLTDIQIEKGRIKTEYIEHTITTAKDNKARQQIEDLSLNCNKQILASDWVAEGRIREKILRQDFLDSGETEHWYGVQWTEESDPDNVVAINSDNDYELHALLPIQNKMRRCVVQDGIVQYYLHDDNSELKADGTLARLDGSDGNVMVEIPEFFYRCEEETVGGIRTIRLKISEQGLPGFIFSRKRYTSAYEATIDREANILASVCTTTFTRATQEVKSEAEGKYVVGDIYSYGTQETAQRYGFTPNASKYRGGTNNSEFDNETDPVSTNFSRNQLGTPISNINRQQSREYSDPENNIFMDLYDTQKTIWILAQVEHKTRNIQKPISEGGLGWGATVYPDYNAYEAFFSPQGGISCIPCGITNSLGNNSGEVYYKMQNVPVESVGAKEAIEYTRFADLWMPVMSYRGIENYYGHLYSIIDQVSIKVMPTGEYYVGQDGNKYWQYYNVSYYYEANPFLTDDKEDEGKHIGTYKFMSNTRVLKSLMLGKNAHILHIDTYEDEYSNYNVHYGDCSELLAGFGYPTMNGRIVSKPLVGFHFMVTVGNMSDDYARPSDGTRMNMF